MNKNTKITLTMTKTVKVTLPLKKFISDFGKTSCHTAKFDCKTNEVIWNYNTREEIRYPLDKFIKLYILDDDDDYYESLIVDDFKGTKQVVKNYTLSDQNKKG